LSGFSFFGIEIAIGIEIDYPHLRRPFLFDPDSHPDFDLDYPDRAVND